MKDLKNIIRFALLILALQAGSLIHAQCTATIIALPGSNGAYSYTAIPSPPTASLSWIMAQGSPSAASGSTASTNYFSNGTATVFLQVTTGSCSAMATQTVIVNNYTCNLAAGATYTQGTNGQVFFTNTTTGASPWVSYFWNFGNGTSSAVSPVNTFTTGGVYNVTLTANNGGGCTNTVVIPVTVQPPCIASFTTAINGASLSLTSTSQNTTGATNFSWTVVNNSVVPLYTTSGIGTSTAAYTFSSNGVYTVSLILNDNSTCYSQISQQLVIAGASPCTIAVNNSSMVSGCTGTASIISTNVCAPATFTWLPINVVGNSVAGLCPGVYTVYSSGGQGNCCPTASRSFTIQNCTLSASFTTSTNGLNTVNFANTSAGLQAGATYSWNFGAAGVSALANPTVVFPGSGVYTVTFTVQNPNSCTSTYIGTVAATQSVSTCNADFQFQQGANGLFSFTNTSSPLHSTAVQDWNFGNLNSLTSSSAVVTNSYAYNGIYTVTMVHSVGGCTSTISKTVNVSTALPCTLTASLGYSVGATGTATFFSTSTGTVSAATFAWAFSNGAMGTGSVITASFPAPGSYSVNLNATNGPGCSSDFTTVINIPCNILPAFSHTVYGNGNVQFVNNSLFSGPGYTYHWDFGDGVSDTGESVSHNYSNAGAHLVKFKMINILQPSCRDSAVMSVNVTGISCVANAGFTLVPSGQPQDWLAVPHYPWNIVAAEWSWGDGNTADSLYASHQYSSAGNYSICLSVTVSCGASGTACSAYYLNRGGAAMNMVTVRVVRPGVFPTGIADEKEPETLIFPNPASEYFIVNTPDNRSIVVLRDVSGRVVRSCGLEQGENVLPTTGLSGGLYFLEIQNGSGIRRTRLVITR